MSTSLYKMLENNILNDVDEVHKFKHVWLACENNNLEVAKLLIQKGTDLHYFLDTACSIGSIEVAKLLIENGADNFKSCLWVACARDHIEIAKLMIEKGADNFNFCLQYTCEIGGNIEIAKLLIENGADNFNFCLGDACRGGNLKIVKLLIKYGADNYKECLQDIFEGGNYKIAKLILKKCNNNINIDYIIDFSLSKARKNKMLKIVEVLLDKRIDMSCEQNINNIYRIKKSNKKLVRKVLYRLPDSVIKDILCKFKH